ncbi:MAG: 23S rRNA (adenine(1618)-N(6))-methyltransferase RlmF [Colwellia sp.]|nr:23S rRNA (adenine(1618)-N(6))-methyltransferase RlmF [Colwellia sp.]
MQIKDNLHPRNVHKYGYDFTALALSSPTLAPFIYTNKYQNLSIDFSDANAVKALNLALLKQHYKITHWDIPQGYLCPPIPGRIDYIHYLADLLKTTNNNKIPNSENITVVDIGTGASCIYPLLGHQQYKWRFVATDIDPISIEYANKNIQANIHLDDAITCVLQEDTKSIFKGILQADKKYDLTMCNPPFHRSIEEATQGSQRKWQNLNITKDKAKSPPSTNKRNQEVKLNFGGQNAELWCAGGELTFIKNIINESCHYQQQVLWFTSLISKKDNLSAIKQALKKAKVVEIKIIKMAQGQKTSRFIAWSFLNKEQQQAWFYRK